MSARLLPHLGVGRHFIYDGAPEDRAKIRIDVFYSQFEAPLVRGMVKSTFRLPSH